MRFHWPVFLFCIFLTLGGAVLAEAESRPQSEDKGKSYSISIYGGTLTDDDWQKSITGQADFVDSHLLVASAGWTFWRESKRRYSLGLEANVARHFGTQKHWEFNLPILTTNWDKFPWHDTLEQTLGFGMGPSVTTKRPRTEEEINPSSKHLMLYWHIDTTFSLPDSPWALILRLHHRSTAYGVFGDEGGSNALTTGLRYNF
ncbi:MAG: hypothetical protein ACLFSY_01230 [Desulfonatronovibrionaceae bacterium]